MFETLSVAPGVTRTAGAVEVVSARDVLCRARAEQAAARRAEVGLLECALAWAHLHPSIDGTDAAEDAAAFFDAAGEEPISGVGVPGVAEFSVAEFRVAELGSELGLSTTAAKRLIGHALELAHRLPRLWGRVRAGEVEPWRARRVAEATIHAFPRLTAEAAGWVDAQVAPYAGRVGQAQVDRLVAAAIERFHLDSGAAESVDEVVERLHVTITGDELSFAGTMDITATVTTADGLDLEHALRAGAEELKALGSSEPLGARRARALGQIARRQTSFDLTFDEPAPIRAKTARRLDLHLHFAADASTGLAPTGFLENGQRLVRLDQVKSWLGDSLTEVRVLPVIDLNASLASEGYVPSPRLRRQVHLRDVTCVFPWCSRPARACDLDHVIPYDPHREQWREPEGDPPQTRTENLAALCRSHHRLKTHTGWHLTSPANGVFEWTSPHGHQYRRDADGTSRLPHPVGETSRGGPAYPHLS